jgi:hypothetical protein
VFQIADRQWLYYACTGVVALWRGFTKVCKGVQDAEEEAHVISRVAVFPSPDASSALIEQCLNCQFIVCSRFRICARIDGVFTGQLYYPNPAIWRIYTAVVA